MEVQAKKELRREKLKELYEHNDATGGSGEKIITYTDLRSSEEDKQVHLAYQYLEDKGFISYRHFGGNNKYAAKINSRGIDEVESESE